MGDFNFNTFSQTVKEYNLHSCVYCQAFLVDTILIRELACEWTVPAEQVKAACDNGCTFLQECSRLYRLADGEGEEDESVYICVNYDLDSNFLLGSHWGRDINMGITIIGPADGREPCELMCNTKQALVELRAGNPSRSEEHRLLAIHPCINDDKLFHNVRNMLQECRDRHDRCRRRRTTHAPPPSRLIEIRHEVNESIRVLETASIRNPSWAALSYCWGANEQNGKTTNNNINERRIQLALCDLPLTIRDSVHVCRQLNIKYLWIDSICIIQDDETDKIAEIAKMAGIYQDAIITISASSASSADKGFLEVRRPYSPGVALPVRTEKGYFVGQLTAHGCNLQPEPVDSRAWTFQERALSTRFLSFATNGVEWKCNQLDCNFDKHGRYSKPHVFELYTRLHWNNRWKALVNGYSVRRLRYVEDRPVAFAGVAQAYCEANHLKPEDYLAGLWLQTLLKDLLWSIEPLSFSLHNLSIDQRSILNSTGDPYIAPSWSWMSATYPIFWPQYYSVQTSKVISIHTEVLQPDVPFGAVKSGKIRLRGLLHHDQHSIDWSNEVTREYKHEPSSGTHERKFFTPCLDFLQDEHVWFFEIGVFDDRKGYRPHPTPQEDPFHEEDSLEEQYSPEDEDLDGTSIGLMLLPTGKENEFTRVGMYEENPRRTFGEDFFDKSCKWCALNKEKKRSEIEII